MTKSRFSLAWLVRLVAWAEIVGGAVLVAQSAVFLAVDPSPRPEAVLRATLGVATVLAGEALRRGAVWGLWRSALCQALQVLWMASPHVLWRFACGLYLTRSSTFASASQSWSRPRPWRNESTTMILVPTTQLVPGGYAGPMLVASGLRKAFGERVAVDGVGLRIDSGEVYGLLGPNGAGKTTTISMIAGVLERDAGSVTIDGVDIDAGPPARARIGLVPQQITLYDDLTGRENLAFWGRMYGLRRRELRSAVEAALDAVGLAERADDRVGAYSGGMQRRLNLAAGILHDPSLVILDEPSVGVDPQSRSAIFELVEGLRDGGKAILYTTHYMEEAERLCDRIGIIDAGRLVAEGTRRELVASLGEEVRIDVGFEPGVRLERAAGVATGLPGVRAACVSGGCLQVFADDGPRRMPALLTALLDAKLAPSSVALVEPNLEDVFLRLTGRALRD